MKDVQAVLVALLIIAPIACHDDRPAESPTHGAAGAGTAGAPAPDNSPAPAPATTNQPNDVESPKLNDSPRQIDPTGIAPISDSRVRVTPYMVAQPGGGQGGFSGAPFGGTGGSIITSSR